MPRLNPRAFWSDSSPFYGRSRTLRSKGLVILNKAEKSITLYLH
nr:MAG TPA: hypothetical protein [Caudoviricetes sp.]